LITAESGYMDLPADAIVKVNDLLSPRPSADHTSRETVYVDEGVRLINVPLHELVNAP
jgi:hypothetical protein